MVNIVQSINLHITMVIWNQNYVRKLRMLCQYPANGPNAGEGRMLLSIFKTKQNISARVSVNDFNGNGCNVLSRKQNL